jgi:hypothetical protein
MTVIEMNVARLLQPSKRHHEGQGLWGTNERRAVLIGVVAGILLAVAGYSESILAFLFAAFFLREAYLRKKAGSWPEAKLFWFI